MKITDDNIEQEEASNNQKDSNTAKDKPVVNRALKPKSSNEQNSYNLRTIVIPYDLTRKFLDVAEANTKRNVETCGILAGKLVCILYMHFHLKKIILNNLIFQRAIINFFLVIV